jgi:hypothetical protein
VVCNGLAKSSRLDVTLLLIPYAPLSPNAAPLPWLPAKSREIVTAIRSKLATLTG